MAAGLASCVDTEKPVFQVPTTFTVNTPGMQDQLLETTGDMDSNAAFMLYCSQPDYGFATKCSYNAQVSLSENFIDEVVDDNGEITQASSYVAISNQEPASAAMRFKTYDLAVAMCQLLGISNPKDPEWDPEKAWQEYVADGGAMQMPVYFRATCEIPGVKDSFIASTNVVSYNNVTLNYAVPAPGFIFCVGDQSCWEKPNDPTSGIPLNPDGTAANGFKDPSATNKEFYENYKLIEPEIGCKLFAATFFMPATELVHAGADGNNYNTQWRFFTELVGWDKTAYEIASHTDNFFVLPITGDFSDKLNDGSLYKGDAVFGDGNWGVLLPETTAMTLVVSSEVSDKPKVWYKIGTWDVTVGLDEKGIKEPVFAEPSEEE